MDSKLSVRQNPQAVVIQNVKQAILHHNLEEACEWMIEADLSEWRDALWEKLFITASHNININNPKLPLYLWTKYTGYLAIKQMFAEQVCVSTEFSNCHLSDVVEWRELWVEVVGVLTLGLKGKLVELTKVKPALLADQITYIHTHSDMVLAGISQCICLGPTLSPPPKTSFFSFCSLPFFFGIALVWFCNRAIGVASCF
jgi:hypothetical protein